MKFSRKWLVALAGSVLAWSMATTLAIVEIVTGAEVGLAPIRAVLLSASGISTICLVIWQRTAHSEDVFEEGVAKGRRLEREGDGRDGGRRHDDPERRPSTAELRIIRGGQ